MSKNIGNLNLGNSSRLKYDKCAYPDSLSESVAPGTYRLQPYYNYNCNSCQFVNGPRSSVGGYESSTVVENGPAISQKLVDVESVLSNRPVKTSRCKSGKTNPVRVGDYKLIQAPVCSNKDDFPSYTHLSHPAYNYREMPLNRFFNLPKDPQANIFYDFAVNTVLEAKDNFVYNIPYVQ